MGMTGSGGVRRTEEASPESLSPSFIQQMRKRSGTGGLGLPGAELLGKSSPHGAQQKGPDALEVRGISTTMAGTIMTTPLYPASHGHPGLPGLTLSSYSHR